MRRACWIRQASSTFLWLSLAGCCLILWHLVIIEVFGLSGHMNTYQQSSRSVPSHSSACGCSRNYSTVDIENRNDVHKETDNWDWCGLESTLRGPHQKIVAFSIYGKSDDKDSMRYYNFMRDNAVRINQVLPGWIMRVYHNLEADTAEHKLICKVYCDSPWMDLCDIDALRRALSKREKDRSKPDKRPVTGEQISHMNRMMWRLIPMLDPLVDIFLSRDLDSFIIDREVVALQQWLNSSFTFSIMRDHHGHTHKILGGLFGVKNFRRRDLVEGLGRILINYGQVDKYNLDQELLANIVWPVAKHDVMAHDSYNCKKRWNALPTYPYPTQRENWTFVSANLEGRWDDPSKCPVACRPPSHPDWEYC